MAPRSGVAVVGSISADLTVFAAALPRPGETVIGETFSLVLGGKGANQALAAARAGAPTFMIGAVGNDHFGNLTLGTLRADGVDTSGVLVLDGATGVAHIRVDISSGENDIVIVPQANHRLKPDAVEHALRELRDRISVVLVQLETPLEVVQRVTAVCRALDLRLILDPAPAQPLPDGAWSGVFAVKPNETEASILTGHPVTDQASAERAARWFLDRGVEVAVITLGSRGALAIFGDTVQVLPAFAVDAVDTTAAGDAFTGALGAGLAGGLALADALRRALAASALAVTVRGASPSLPTAAAVDVFLLAHS